MLAGATKAELQDLEPVLFRFALRAVRDAELAKDLVQETLLAAVAAAQPFAGRSTLRTWLIGILSHKATDHFRRQAAMPQVDGVEAELLATPSAEDVERVVAARQDLRAVEKALGVLTEQERLAVLLTDVESIERVEVCRVMSVTATHLRVLLHRGRNRLRRELERG